MTIVGHQLVGHFKFEYMDVVQTERDQSKAVPNKVITNVTLFGR